jgi:hypothetical protein
MIRQNRARKDRSSQVIITRDVSMQRCDVFQMFIAIIVRYGTAKSVILEWE